MQLDKALLALAGRVMYTHKGLPMPQSVALWLARRVMARYEPDLVLPGYLRRWYLRPRDPRGDNIYLHQFEGSDSPDPHDHPWHSVSIVLSGWMREYISDKLSGLMYQRDRTPGDIVERPADHTHRLELPESVDDCVTLFVTGPKWREWGFYNHRGKWRHHTEGR